MMEVEKIDAELTEAQKQALRAAFQTIRENLPFRANLTPTQRRSVAKAGNKSRAFVQKASALAARDSSFLARSFDDAGFQKRVKLMQEMDEFVLAGEALRDMLFDTALLVSSQAYNEALEVYDSAKKAGSGAELDAAVSELGERFAGQSKKRSKSTTSPMKSTENDG